MPTWWTDGEGRSGRESTTESFRPKKSAHDAVDDVALSLNRGYTEVIDADLSKYFDTKMGTDLIFPNLQAIVPMLPKANFAIGVILTTQ